MGGGLTWGGSAASRQSRRLGAGSGCRVATLRSGRDCKRLAFFIFGDIRNDAWFAEITLVQAESSFVYC